ncbi:MAG: response regulator [Candidatus Eremiobacteraeota bacterium]|nr:response regulator [Candidatus Eremiobacteraeota bacterium]
MPKSDNIRVLYVEDDIDTARFLSRKLIKKGYSVDIALDGEEGLSKLEMKDYDILLLDHYLPLYSGLEMIEILTEKNALPSTIMITAMSDVKMAVKAMKMGASDYIIKDVEVEYIELIPSTIEKVLNQKKLIEEKKKAEESLRESEERFRLLFEQSNDAIFIQSLDGKIVNVNQRACEMLKMEEAELIDTCIFDLCLPEERKFYEKKFHEIREKGDVISESQLSRKDSESVSVEISSRIVNGKRHVVQSIMRDITIRRKMERELAKVEKLESLGVLAGGIAHDFNNVLSGIIGNISIAKLDVEPEDALNEYLNEATKASLRAKNLVQQLLVFSRGGEPIRKICNIEELLRESAKFSLIGSNIKVEFIFSPDFWAVEIDEGQIRQVISNIVLNAQQSMPGGGIVKVEVANKLIESGGILPLDPGKYVEIIIQDKGIGIQEKNLTKVFDPYFTTKKKGNGLGLTTCYSIIRKHGGYITVESELDVGTAFHIYIPASGEKVILKRKSQPMILKSGQGRVLVMDDEEVIIKVLDKMLVHLGYEADFTNNGFEAINKYRMARDEGNPFDMVIMDLTIPGGMGGKDAIKEILKIDPNIRAIVSSGYSNDPIMANFREYGFRACLAKPYKIGELEEVLQAVMED